MNIPVLFEDEHLCIVDKPRGLLTIPTPAKESRTLESILNDDAREKGVTYRLHPCHRLDRDTSGAIVFAKGKATQQRMMERFHARLVKKTYWALTSGNLQERRGTVVSPIEGRKSVTHYKVIEKRGGFDIVEIMPETGRTNQIRIHFRQIGHPVLGDTKFAFRRDFTFKTKSLMLHAYTISFPHPVTGGEVAAKAPLPKDMETFIQEHR
jgi:23S rRNA pseudouridine1911/1915/1917 synthase